MSTLTVSNIKKTGETASRDVSGVAAAWVNFNGTGTVAISDSVNVASITDSGVGVYYSNFSTTFSNSDYSATITASDAYPNIGNCIAILTDTGATTASRLGMVNINATTNSYFDSSVVCVSINGGLA